MNIDDFLVLDYPEVYDLKDENNYQGANSLEKMMKYKSLKDGFDCDGSGEGKRKNNYCELMRQIYRILWGWKDVYINKNGQEFVKRYAETYIDDWFLMGPETMNSFSTTFNQCQKNRGYEQYKELMNLWAAVVGRIGNMTLTYAGFNKYIANDYWDIKIKRQYIDNISLSELAKTRYVNYFFQWDYVVINNNRYEYKAFWQGHETKYIPNDMNTIKNYIQKIDIYTRKRGLFIYALLKIVSICEEDYFKIRDIIFMSEKVYSGYSAVIEEILTLSFKKRESAEILINCEKKISDVEESK